MALRKNTFTLKGGLKITNSEPVDQRILFDNIADVSGITSAVTDIYYKGLVASTPEGKIYILTGNTPSSVTSWVDVTGEGVTPTGTVIPLGKDLIYSGQTIALSTDFVTDAFDAVVEKMIENERVVAAALNDLQGDVDVLAQSADTLMQSATSLNSRVNTLSLSANTLNTKFNNLSATTKDLSATTVYITENYAKKSDISNVYKIVAGSVVDISVSGYSIGNETVTTSLVKNVAVGDVVNTTSSVTYNGKTYAVGTNFVCLSAATDNVKWDALAGIEDLSAYAKETELSAYTKTTELVNYPKIIELSAYTLQDIVMDPSGDTAGYVTGVTWATGETSTGRTKLIFHRAKDVKVDNASTADTLNGFDIQTNESLTTTKGYAVGMVKKDTTTNKIYYKLVDEINIAYSAMTLSGFTVSADTNTITYTEGQVVAIIGKKSNDNKIYYRTTDKINSATTAASAITDGVGNNIATCFAKLDQYPSKATKPSAKMRVIPIDYTTGTTFEIGTQFNTQIKYSAETIDGHFNASYGEQPQPAQVQYTEKVIGITGITGGLETSTTVAMTVTADTLNNEFCGVTGVTYGENNVLVRYSFHYTAPSNSAVTLLGKQTIETGSTAEDHAATWTASTAVDTVILPYYGAYPLYTNMPSATTTGNNTITADEFLLSPVIETDKKYLLYNAAKTYYITFPPTVGLAEEVRKYMIRYDNRLGSLTIKKWNDLAREYNGDVEYTSEGSQHIITITIQAPAESEAPAYRLVFS